jgi:hypothetical protein
VADGKTDRVGKAYVTKNFPAVMRGDVVEVKARYLIVQAPTDGSLYLMDVECRHCGPRWKAGIRVYSRGGNVRVNRGKLGLEDDFISTTDERLPIGESFVLSLKLRLGDDSGETTVSVDGTPVIVRRGINMPLRRILAMRDEHLSEEQLDYVQFGITATVSDWPSQGDHELPCLSVSSGHSRRQAVLGLFRHSSPESVESLTEPI